MANIFAKSRTFWSEMLAELKKASWPTPSQLRGTTWVMLISILLLGCFIALSDFSVYNWVSLLSRLIKGA